MRIGVNALSRFACRNFQSHRNDYYKMVIDGLSYIAVAANLGPYRQV
jgi:hypothetical protein